jgi:hypothetical protein
MPWSFSWSRKNGAVPCGFLVLAEWRLNHVDGYALNSGSDFTYSQSYFVVTDAGDSWLFSAPAKSIAGCGLYATCRILQADCTEHLGRKAKVKNPE